MRNWIFPGIEDYLSCNTINGRTPERFVKNPELVIKYLNDLIPEKLETRYAIFKPLIDFSDDEKPEVVIFFANADQLSALVFLLFYEEPMRDDLVTTVFSSACASVTTFPLKYARSNQMKAFCGMHDISARVKLPMELMTLAMPYKLLEKIYSYIDDSFIKTEQWAAIKNRF